MAKSYIRGKFANAACVFMNELAEMGIVATVGYAGTRKKELLVYVRKREDVPRVPKTWNQFTIKTEWENILEQD